MCATARGSEGKRDALFGPVRAVFDPERVADLIERLHGLNPLKWAAARRLPSLAARRMCALHICAKPNVKDKNEIH